MSRTLPTVCQHDVVLDWGDFGDGEVETCAACDARPVDRILWNERPTATGGGGDIDEIVLHNVTVHVEQMDGRCWWIGIYRGDDRFAGNFSCDSRGRMSFSMQEDDLPWDLDESHEDRS